MLPKALRAHLAFIWCQEECTTDGQKDAPAGVDGSERKPLLLKELRRVWQRWPQWGPLIRTLTLTLILTRTLTLNLNPHTNR